MRRWNGWGDDSQTDVLQPQQLDFLVARIGRGKPTQDAQREQALEQVPESQLSGIRGLDTDAETRLDHARGQSYPDWLAMRYGRMGPFPDAVAKPRSHADVVDLLTSASRRGWAVIPYGGGTSVVGHLNVNGNGRPVLSIDMRKMCRLRALDETAGLASFGAGVPGSVLEAQLFAHGYTLGHFPQSFEYSTLGGWVAARSSGQQSMRYGRIEQLFAGGRMVTPAGELDFPCLPASAAGPDLRQLALGSEGRMGILTEATVRVRRVPKREAFHAVFFRSWESACEAVRTLGQAQLPLSMLRLSNARETQTQLALAGQSAAIKWLQRYLHMRGQGDGQCMLLVGITGTPAECRYARYAALRVSRRHGGVHAGKAIGKAWSGARFAGPYLRNGLWAAGYGADTVESAVSWPQVTPLMQAVEDAAGAAFSEHDDRVHAFTHLSHVHPQGSSIYSTFVFPASGDYTTDYQRWRTLKTRVSEAIVAHGGTISHQHGVGSDHKQWLAAEKGELGLQGLADALHCFDPDGLMNPGKLLD